MRGKRRVSADAQAMAESNVERSSEQVPPPTISGAARRSASRWLAGVSKPTLAILLLVYITVLHAIGLGTFTQGFLLTRLTIPEVAEPYSVSNQPPLPATHSKAVVIIIDALRTDFISPFHPQPPSPFHHGVLTLPAELTASNPGHSLIFNSYSDPPTTTMQRIKGITTGSLPTFIDAGANFASTAIEEDNLIAQATAANRSVVFMGDDTWLNLFPQSFKHAHPFESFNVEDLHTVDNGVIKHIFPYLQNGGWDILIGHFLGVDHVGHRVGPDRDTMREKLEQMDQVLRKVVDELDDDTLLVVLGDHGMNPKGDHGGDSELEVDAALWLYSKGRPLNAGNAPGKWPEYVFPGAKQSLRQVNQIDLVPTLALLLGLPIPYNNLGEVIPECFSSSPEVLEAATRVNTEQIERYLEAYGNKDVLAAVQRQKTRSSAALQSGDVMDRAVANRDIALAALSELRAIWAQFSITHILVGIVALSSSLAATIALYLGVRNSSVNWDVYVRVALDTALTAGVVVGSVVGTAAGAFTRDPLAAIQAFFVGTAIVSASVLATPLFSAQSWRSVTWNVDRVLGPLILVLHCVSFASNSYIMWEDRMVTFFLVTIGLVHFGRALNAPTAAGRLRLLLFSLLFMAVVRAISLSTVCREEQQPYCRVTFWQGSSAPEWAIYAVTPVMLMVLPRIVGIVMGWSRSFAGPAPLFVGGVWRATVIINSIVVLLEWSETWDGLNPDRIPLVHMARKWAARASLGVSLGALPYLFATTPLCIDIVREKDQDGDDKVSIFGFGNAFGSTYLLFLLIGFAVVQVVSTAVSQIILVGILVAIIAHLELVDTQRDSILLQQQFASSTPAAFDGNVGDALVRPSFTDVVPIALLGLLAFFATGHQAVLASIQWKSAFTLFEDVVYPWSPLLVVVNTWGPTAFVILAVPLLAIWNVSPRANASTPVLAHTVQVALATVIYYAAITLASAVTAAWLRRHLMVWKVFAPRFMLAAVMLLLVDLAVIAGIGGVRVTSSKVWKTFKCVAQ